MKKIFAFILILLAPTFIMACTCNSVSGPATIVDFTKIDVIVSGQVNKISLLESENPRKKLLVEFKIENIFKGEGLEETIKIYTSQYGCGLSVKENEEWIIWAYNNDGIISTNSCTRSVRKQKINPIELKSLHYFQSNPSATEWTNHKGTVIATGKMKNHNPVGHWKYYDFRGELESQGEYRNGKKHGIWIEYLSSSFIVKDLRKQNIIPKDSTPNLDLFKNRISEIGHYKNGLKHGEFVNYTHHSARKPISTENYKYGKADGKTISYYENGLTEVEANFKEGKREGIYRKYYENGQLKLIGQFKNDKPVGEFKLYNESGVLLKTSIDVVPE
ncbi:hypothetical protein [Ekhidna sp.]